MQVASIIGGFFLILAWAGVAYALLALWLAGRWRVRDPAPPMPAPPAVSLLKPLYGDEPELAANLTSFFAQDYAGPRQIVFGVHDAGDPAARIAGALCDAHPAADTALVIDPRVHGINGKVSNLVNMRSHARHDIMVLSDSDIRVDPDYLRRIVAALRPTDVGAVSCLYTGFSAHGGLGARFSAMGINTHFLPNVIVGLGLGLAHPCMGSTIAIKRAVLEKIGDFAAFADHLADDYEIGRAVREAGFKVAIPAMVVRHACAETSLRDWFAHELRWARTIRVNDPAGHFGSVVTHPVPLSLIGLICCGFTGFSIGTLAATLLARGVLKWRMEARFGGDASPFWLLPVRDVLSFVVFGFSLLGGRVAWRGARMRVGPKGVMSKD